MAKILLVDDERLIVELLQKVLSKHGHTVHTAVNGEEALKLFGEHRPHLTVLDLAMPRLSGVEVLTEIRKLDPTAPVIALTGHASEAQHEAVLRLGVTAVLRKTAGLDLIEGVLLSTLQEKGPRTILVVDDEKGVCAMLEKKLTLSGYDVRTAESGEAALASLERCRPDLMLLDMYMPGMFGIEVVRILRARGDALPIIVLTASQDASLLDECLRLSGPGHSDQPHPGCTVKAEHSWLVRPSPGCCLVRESQNGREGHRPDAISQTLGPLQHVNIIQRAVLPA